MSADQPTHKLNREALSGEVIDQVEPRSAKPFFIVGNPRSGTTLLRFILSSHSRIYIPEETGFLPHLAHLAERTLTRDEVATLTRQIGQMNREWLNLVTDDDAFFAQLETPCLRTVLEHLYRLRITDQQAQRWGDKGPSYVRWIPQIERIFPDALFIHMIRDGRDSSLSALKKWGRDYWYYDMYYLLKNWSRNVAAGQTAGRRLGTQRYLEVRYEQLVSEPEQVVPRICDFLGEPFETTMLDHTGLAKQLIAPTGHFEVEQPVNQRTVENWRRRMTLRDQKLANRLIGKQLASLGYEVPTLPAMTLSERLRELRLAIKFRLTDSLRRLLYATGWLKISREKAATR